jgi:hypothetical protein
MDMAVFRTLGKPFQHDLQQDPCPDISACEGGIHTLIRLWKQFKQREGQQESPAECQKQPEFRATPGSYDQQEQKAQQYSQRR